MGGLNVKIWMMKNDLRVTDIAEEYGCRDSFVSNFLKGRRRSKDLVAYLIDKGCPKKFFNNGNEAA